MAADAASDGTFSTASAATPDAATDLTGWIATLDQLETGLSRFEAQLDAGDDAVFAGPGSWAPPRGLGSLPAQLQQRATSLSWRMTAIEQRARDRRKALEARLADLERRRDAGAAYAAAGPAFTTTGEELV
jgi:hypothetical protein